VRRVRAAAVAVLLLLLHELEQRVSCPLRARMRCLCHHLRYWQFLDVPILRDRGVPWLLIHLLHWVGHDLLRLPLIPTRSLDRRLWSSLLPVSEEDSAWRVEVRWQSSIFVRCEAAWQ